MRSTDDGRWRRAAPGDLASSVRWLGYRRTGPAAAPEVNRLRRHACRVTDTPPNNRQAAEINVVLTGLIAEAGRAMGFEVRTEYPVPGGRLDVVWSLHPSRPIPHFDGSIPVVGFEIESSWRSRKHVKGDLLNLQDCGVALGVIVLAGSGAKEDSLRRFAKALVDRPGARMLIWTEEDVRSLVSGQRVVDLPLPVGDEIDETAGMEPVEARPVEHTGRYRLLWEWLRDQERRPVTITFADIEDVIGTSLPDSCREHAAHWHSYKGSAVGRAIIDAGWRARNVQLNAGTVTFVPDEMTGQRSVP